MRYYLEIYRNIGNFLGVGNGNVFVLQYFKGVSKMINRERAGHSSRHAVYFFATGLSNTAALALSLSPPYNTTWGVLNSLEWLRQRGCLIILIRRFIVIRPTMHAKTRYPSQFDTPYLVMITMSPRNSIRGSVLVPHPKTALGIKPHAI